MPFIFKLNHTTGKKERKKERGKNEKKRTCRDLKLTLLNDTCEIPFPRRLWTSPQLTGSLYQHGFPERSRLKILAMKDSNTTLIPQRWRGRRDASFIPDFHPLNVLPQVPRPGRLLFDYYPYGKGV